MAQIILKLFIEHVLNTEGGSGDTKLVLVLCRGTMGLILPPTFLFQWEQCLKCYAKTKWKKATATKSQTKQTQKPKQTSVLQHKVQEGLVRPSSSYFKAEWLIVITMLKWTKNLQTGGLATWRTFIKKHFMWFLFHLHTHIHTYTYIHEKTLVSKDSHYHQVLTQPFP